MLLQAGIKSIIGFTKQVHGCRRWNFFVLSRWLLVVVESRSNRGYFTLGETRFMFVWFSF